MFALTALKCTFMVIFFFNYGGDGIVSKYTILRDLCFNCGKENFKLITENFKLITENMRKIGK